MIDSYHHLRSGLATDEALRRAQLDMIAAARESSVLGRWLERVRGRDAADETRAHPFHWAGFQVSESSRVP
jgi:CHAT domain-containing protein